MIDGCRFLTVLFPSCLSFHTLPSSLSFRLCFSQLSHTLFCFPPHMLSSLPQLWLGVLYKLSTPYMCLFSLCRRVCVSNVSITVHTSMSLHVKFTYCNNWKWRQTALSVSILDWNKLKLLRKCLYFLTLSICLIKKQTILNKPPNTHNLGRTLPLFLPFLRLFSQLATSPIYLPVVKYGPVISNIIF